MSASTTGRAWLLATLGLIPFLFVGGPGPFASRSASAAWDVGHAVIMFAAVIGVWGVFDRLHARPRAFAVLALAGSVGAGGAIEFLQGFVGREQAVWDIVVGLSGAALALLWTSFGVRRAPLLSTGVRVGAAVIIGLANLTPTGLALADESRARRDFPVLAEFRDRLELTRWEGLDPGALLPREPGSHDGALRLRAEAGEGVSLHLRYMPRDWRGYREVRMRVHYSGEATLLRCRLNDLTHDLRIPHQASDHYEGAFPLDTGWQDLAIDLGVAAASLATRTMDLHEMNGLTCFLPSTAGRQELLIDRVGLSR